MDETSKEKIEDHKPATNVNADPSHSRKSRLKGIAVSDLLASVALLVSIVTVYLSVFFKDHDLTVSLIDTKLYDGGNIISNLLYYNRGNTYSTIVQNYLVFYQQDDWQNEGVLFREGKHVYELDYDPAVLIPGEQILRVIDMDVDFTKIDTLSRKLNLNDQIKVGLVVSYINDDGMRTSDMFPVGYIQLNSSRRIIKYKLEYDVFNLDGDHFYKSKSIE